MNTEVNEYFDHPYNDTKNCERAVEIPLAFNYLDWIAGDVVEIGAVTCYYRPASHIVIDPVDAYATKKALSQDCTFKNLNVLSISTIEHLGFGDYVPEINYGLAFNELYRIVMESKTCFITWPIGYNKIFDSQVKANYSLFNYFFYEKISDHPKRWSKSESIKCFDYQYGPRGNCIICIYKGF